MNVKVLPVLNFKKKKIICRYILFAKVDSHEFLIFKDIYFIITNIQDMNM